MVTHKRYRHYKIRKQKLKVILLKKARTAYSVSRNGGLLSALMFFLHEKTSNLTENKTFAKSPLREAAGRS